MAQEQVASPKKPAWTKIFTAFKIALDLKKMALAAAGILCVFVGWWLLSWAFYSTRTMPVWADYDIADRDKKESWVLFKAKRQSWNLLHELAGSPNDHRKMDAADLATNYDDFALLKKWEDGYRRTLEAIKVKIDEKDGTYSVFIAGTGFSLQLGLAPGTTEDKVIALKERKDLTTLALLFAAKEDEKSKTLWIDGVKLVPTGKVEEVRKYRDEALDLKQIRAEGKAKEKLLALFEAELINPRYKPTGRLCTPPFSEDRGDNPYLIVVRAIKLAGDSSGSSTHFTKWLIHEEAPVVLEPLCKLLLPLVYLFDARAGAFDRIYLSLVMLWTLAVWGFFGGAICRIAAVQIARNERITLSEAIAFTRERFVSYFAAPVFPLVLILILTVMLIVFGWLEWTPYIGDLFAGLFWPIVILLGFIMTIVLVGMVGWPLMVATISTEGSDSFDALSRSYSYVYQAPWQYLWYNFLAMLYGAVLIFFVGFMASLMVFMGKWAVSSAPGLAGDRAANDREPSYLFTYAPKSFGWRNLLISNSQFVETVEERTAAGRLEKRLEFKQDYKESMTLFNNIGAGMVTFWLWIVFLLVLGFGYSYFWTASTIVYFLMRQHVDDTEMDEVHLEDDDMVDPFAKPAPTAPTAPTPPPPKPGTIPLNVVDAPPAPPAPPTTAITPSPEPPADPTPVPPTPPPGN